MADIERSSSAFFKSPSAVVDQAYSQSQVAKHAQSLGSYRFVIDLYILESWGIKLVQEAVGSRRTLHEVHKRLPDCVVHPRNICE